MHLVHPYPRCRDEREALYAAACRVDGANYNPSDALSQNEPTRVAYEDTMGAALDNLRLLIEAIRDGKSLEKFL